MKSLDDLIARLPALQEKARQRAAQEQASAPAKVVRQLTPEQMQGLRQSAQHYIDNARLFRTTLKRL